MTTATQTKPTREERTDLYPSRQASEPRLLERRDPALWGGESDGPLDAVTLADYEKNGFLTLPAFFSADELATYKDELDRLRSDDAVKNRAETITEPGSDRVRSIFAVHESNEILGGLCRHPKLVAIARQLLGDDVYIHQSRVNYKQGFTGKEFYWHSDFETWHVEDGMPRMRAVSCSVSLTENTPNNGPLLLIPGSQHRFVSCVGETPEDHYKASLKKQEYGVPDADSLAQLADEGGIEAAVGSAGSVIFFECNTMHGSNSNITPFPRSNCFTVYNSVQNRLVEPFSGQAPRPQFIGNRQDVAPIETA